MSAINGFQEMWKMVESMRNCVCLRNSWAENFASNAALQRLGPQRMARTLSNRALTVITVAAALTAGCANDQVPVNATLRITPDTHATTVQEFRDDNDQCLYYTDNYVDIPVLLQLNTSDGSPVGDAPISVYADFAANTFLGFPVLSLYDDLNGNGVVDSPEELISGMNDDIARVKTNQWTGSRMLLLRINLSCAFRGELFAFTGGVSGRASVEVIAGNTRAEDVSEDFSENRNSQFPRSLGRPGT